MVLQYIVIGILFVAALAMLGRMVWRHFSASTCEGCGTCGVDFKSIEEKLDKQRSQQKSSQ